MAADSSLGTPPESACHECVSRRSDHVPGAGSEIDDVHAERGSRPEQRSDLTRCPPESSHPAASGPGKELAGNDADIHRGTSQADGTGALSRCPPQAFGLRSKNPARNRMIW